MSFNEYTSRMNKVLDYIDANLDQPLTLETIADIAHFSPFHFHRLFSAWFGETLGDYLRRRRLAVGAMRLTTNRDMPVLDVALSVGFGSREAFARAFKLQFGSSPTMWRRRRLAERVSQNSNLPHGDSANRNPDQAHGNIDQAFERALRHHACSSPNLKEMSMKVELIEMPPVRVAYLRHIGPYGATINTFWNEKFWPWAKANGLDGRACYGLSHDDPSITPPDKCRYDACIEVPNGFVPGRNSNVTSMPGGRYAALAFKGTPNEISDAWAVLFRDWLPESGLTPDERPCFEYYPADTEFDSESGAFECKLCAPVAAAQKQGLQ